ncbi:hypothetical protein MCAV_00280 [[Mycoplasma] cavipharyngis]|uniref:hypothetical protein n=1 Tax=[Mycoplasma] cavipharyngis TaxID=92757 RepID=UPI0037038DFA
MNFLQIALLTIAILFITIFLIIFLLWLKIWLIQREENKLLIQFNRLENSQVVKREKYINSITTKDYHLNSIVHFLKRSIKVHEQNLKITKQNIFLLRKIKNESDFSNYKKRFNIIKNDVAMLKESITNIDKNALDSKAFKESSLKLLIQLRQIFVEIDNFYIKNLLPQDFFNKNLFRLIDIIKNDLKQINFLISVVNKQELLEKFEEVVRNICIYAKWNSNAYENWKKMQKIADVFQNAQKTKNELNLHFSAQELKDINQSDKLISTNYENTLVALKKGEFTKTKKIINLMLESAFFYDAKIHLSKVEQELLNQKILEEEIINKSSYMLESFVRWAGAIIKEWKQELENSSVAIFEKSDKLFESIRNLSLNVKNLNNAKDNLSQTTNRDLLKFNTEIAKLLVATNLNLSDLNQEIYQSNDQFKMIVKKFWTAKIFLIQILDYAKNLLEPDDSLIQSISNYLDEANKFIERILSSYDEALIVDQEYETFAESIDFYKEVIANVLGHKLFAQKLYRYWYTLTNKNNKFDSNLNQIILEIINKRKWFDAIIWCQNKIIELSSELIKKSTNSNKKFSNLFYRKKKAN